MRVAEKHIDETAKLLSMLAAADDRFYATAIFGGQGRRRGVPSVRTVYDRYTALPPDHPLKAEHPESLVQRGYQKLRTHLNFDDRWSYSDLGIHMFLYMI